MYKYISQHHKPSCNQSQDQCYYGLQSCSQCHQHRPCNSYFSSHWIKRDGKKTTMRTFWEIFWAINICWRGVKKDLNWSELIGFLLVFIRVMRTSLLNWPLMNTSPLVSQCYCDGANCVEAEMFAVVMVVWCYPAHPNWWWILSGKHSHRVEVLKHKHMDIKSQIRTIIRFFYYSQM